MDVALRIADEYALDRAWAWAFPAGSLHVNVAASAPTIKDSLSALGLSIARLGHRGPDAFPLLFTDPSSPFATHQSASLFPRDSVVRQLVSLFWVAYAGSFLLYWSISTLSYYALFDRRLEHHPRFLKNQVRKEITLSMQAMPGMAALIVPWFVGEVRGTTLLYDRVEEYGAGWFKGSALEGYGSWTYLGFSMAVFLLSTDWCIYWIHRWLHIPFFYKRLHKPHHRWLVPTPFSALAFHPVDGYAQSLPYHIIPYILPMNKWLYFGMFMVVNLWTILIHDGDMIHGHFLEKFINSPAHHTLHHLYFTCNYGQYFTWADKYGGSYRPPREDLDPIHDALKNMERKTKLADKEAKTALREQKKQLSPDSTTILVVGLEADQQSDSGYEGSEAETDGKSDAKSTHIRSISRDDSKDVRRRR
ncbi:hypothetical protein QFC21_001262 [Naganishia friedmannii]|uniref:Uncharacterized protein n=1 Tax=Naganishia friedmannii TaxID=89922 RepID=A0ACC2W312_9TREE|nr:hypothetical protein QFC21_001262 [Naganishia friedmannii]